jgi:hypothetical protein
MQSLVLAWKQANVDQSKSKSHIAWPWYMSKVGGLLPSLALLIIVWYLTHPCQLCVKRPSSFCLFDGHPWVAHP